MTDMKNIVKVTENTADSMVEGKKDEGATLVEYALLAALIAVALFAIVAFFMNDVSKSFSRIGSAIVR